MSKESINLLISTMTLDEKLARVDKLGVIINGITKQRGSRSALIDAMEELQALLDHLRSLVEEHDDDWIQAKSGYIDIRKLNP